MIVWCFESMNVFFMVVVIFCIFKFLFVVFSFDFFVIQMFDVFVGYGVIGSFVCVVDFQFSFGVQKDMGGDDQWLSIWCCVLDVDIFVFVMFMWMGQYLSVVQWVFECFDVEFSEIDVCGWLILFDKVVVVGIVGNEDGVYYIVVILFQVLNDVGFMVFVQGLVYWNGEVMYMIDYKDFDEMFEKVVLVICIFMVNVVYFVWLFKGQVYLMLL